MSCLQVSQHTMAETVTKFHVIYRHPDGRIAASDCEYIDWNDAALDLLGIRSLKHRCKSEFRPWQETGNSRLKLAAARLPKHQRCNERLTQCFDRPIDGERLWLHEEVETFGAGENTYWRSRLRVASQPGTLEALSPELYGLTLDDIRQVSGDHYVSSLQALPQDLTSIIALSTIIPEGQKICNIQGQPTVEVGGLSGFLSRFLHCCQRCGLMWASQKHFPRTCARRTQGEDFGCGTKSWWRK